MEFRPNIIDHPCVTPQGRKEWFDEESFPVRVNLGSGVDYLEGWINVEGNPDIKADIHMNLDDPDIKLPWKDGSVHMFYCSHILEHIHHLIPLKAEMIRCLEPGGIIAVVVPNFTSMDAWGDDTHCRAFSKHSFFPDYWPGCGFHSVRTVKVVDSWGNANEWLAGIMVKDQDPGVVSL